MAEIGVPGLMPLGSEVVPHPSCANRIDILAFDGEQGRATVIELKRDRHRLQLLQALSYAGMLSSWTTERYLEELGAGGDEDLRNTIENRDPNASPAVMLLAESYDPEVILTAEWLAAAHRVAISCFSMKVFRFGTHLHLLIQRDFPLRGIDDVYVSRRTPAGGGATLEQTWADVKEWIAFDWGAGAIDEMVATSANNSAARRYFATPFTGEWGGYMLYVHRGGMKVRFHNRRDGDVAYWDGCLGFDAVRTWGAATRLRAYRSRSPLVRRSTRSSPAWDSSPAAEKNPAIDGSAATPRCRKQACSEV